MSKDQANSTDDNTADKSDFRGREEKNEPTSQSRSVRDSAAELIRNKIESLYSGEPSVSDEIKEVKHEVPSAQGPFESKHQEYMYKLSTSGKSLAEIQTQWHDYYLSLPEDEKLKVWQEFYEANGQGQTKFQRATSQIQEAQEKVVKEADTSSNKKKKAKPKHPKVVVAEHVLTVPKKVNRRKIKSAREELIKKISADGKLKAKHHVQSLAFGLGLGFLVVFIFLFGFFNEVIITPFIQPSRNTSSTPIILSTSSAAASAKPEVIIPKINVEIPVDYSETSTNESVIENDLNSGVVHYPTTVLPGQLGNTAYFGHSSNNIFNPGKYKFAFVLLHTLVPGDTFYLVYNGTNYVYQVYQTQIVAPTDVSVLNNVPGKTATATLITCDPPGTSLHRLIVWGQQISPNPGANSQPAAIVTSGSPPTELPGNGPSLWSRFIHFVF